MAKEPDQCPEADQPSNADGEGRWSVRGADGDHRDPFPPIGSGLDPGDPRLDEELLSGGDTRNVVDGYRMWSVEAIRADLDSSRAALHIAIENLQHDLNIGSIVRTANAFNVGGVHIVGRRRWNRRGAMVTDRYLHVHHRPETDDLAQWAKDHDYRLIGIDNTPPCTDLESAPLPERCVLVFGQESTGISPELLAACAEVRKIPMYGSTRSMNVAAAAAIAMHAWSYVHQYGRATPTA